MGGGIGFVKTAENMNIQALEQVFRRFDERGGIVISCHDNAIPDPGSGTAGEKTVIKLDCPVGRDRHIKNIARHNDARDLFLPDQIQKKIQHGAEFMITFHIIQRGAQMPVCCVQDLHRSAFVFRSAVVYPIMPSIMAFTILS